MKPTAVLCRLLLIAACGLALYATVVVCSRIPIVGWLLLAYLIWRRGRRMFGSGYAYGTASMLDFFGLLKWGFLSPSGLVLGTAGYAARPSRLQAVVRGLFSPRVDSAIACRMFLSAFLSPKWASGCLVRIRKFTNLVLFAATGRGKGVSIILPILFSYARSIVCTDPKPELFPLTARHRQRRFKHRIALLDPYLTTGTGHTDALNPLDFIDANAIDFLDACRDLANALVVRQEKGEMQPHFNDMAEIALTAGIAYVCASENNPDRRNLQTVYAILSSKQLFAEAIQAMQATKTHGGVLQRLGDTLGWLKGGSDEQVSVMTTIARHISFLNSPAIANVTTRSTFDPRELRHGKMTLYLCVPPQRLVSNPAIMRMWVSTLLRVLASEGPNEQNEILFLLDEAGHLGSKLKVLEAAVSLMRGFGIRLFFIFQSVKQVAECFGDNAGVFMDNMDTQIYFGTNAYESAETISKRAGDFTMLIESLNDTDSYTRPVGGTGQEAGNATRSSSSTLSEIGRAIVRPDEVIRMPEDFAFVFHKNLPVIPVKLLRYYDHPAFRNGRTGRSGGVGLRGVVAATFCLLVSVVLAVGGMTLAVQATERPEAEGFSDGYGVSDLPPPSLPPPPSFYQR